MLPDQNAKCLKDTNYNTNTNVLAPLRHWICVNFISGDFCSQKAMILSAMRQHQLQHIDPIHPGTEGSFGRKHRRIIFFQPISISFAAHIWYTAFLVTVKTKSSPQWNKRVKRCLTQIIFIWIWTKFYKDAFVKWSNWKWRSVLLLFSKNFLMWTNLYHLD